MGVGILAPVPAVLIDSALETCLRTGVVAFGTNAIDVFIKATETYGAGIPVIIQPTVKYGDQKGYGRKTFFGSFVRFLYANKQGLHPEPSKRPEATLDPEDPDTAVLGFWEVSGLKMMPDRIALSTLSAEGRKSKLPAAYKLHGPIIVTAPFI